MNESVIEQAVFAELQRTAGAEFAVELVDTFLEEAPGMLAELRSAHTEGDADRFRRAAHSLKSNSNTFGASRLAALSRELELGGMNDDPAHDVDALAALDAEYARAAAALKDLCRG
jgi:HPt (histidine-containing phosphotransfer) domain-containing protein